MSHIMDMFVKNIGHTEIQSFSVVHVWDSKGNTLKGTNLAPKGEAGPQEITSGYSNYDWYTIQVTFADATATTKTMDFYCNSSYSQNKVVIEICSSHVNCRYYNKDTGKYETGCLDKGWT